MLRNAGFNDVWLYPEFVNIHVFIPVFRNRLRDMYIASWRTDIDQKSSLTLYKELKRNFEF